MRVGLLVCGLALVGCAESTPLPSVPMVPIDTAEREAPPRELEALGTWSEDPDYGEVWTPNDEAYVPYESDGAWVSLGDETTFVSDAAWALPTYASGRWLTRRTPKGLRWCWAAHARPTPVVPVDVETRAMRPNALSVLDRVHVESHALAVENAARMSEPALLAMHSSARPADEARAFIDAREREWHARDSHESHEHESHASHAWGGHGSGHASGHASGHSHGHGGHH